MWVIFLWNTAYTKYEKFIFKQAYVLFLFSSILSLKIKHEEME